MKEERVGDDRKCAEVVGVGVEVRRGGGVEED